MKGKMGTAALDQVVVVVSFIPTTFAIIALSTAGMDTSDDHFEDKKGVVGGMSGIVCLGYAIMYCVGIGQKSADMCKILIFARMFLGALFIGGGCFLVWKEDLMKAVIMFVFGGFALPEAYLMYVYGQALAREQNSKLEETGAQMASLAAPSAASMPGWGVTPMSMPGSFGMPGQQGNPGGGFGAPPPQQYYG